MFPSSTANFPESSPRAASAVAQFRQGRKEPVPLTMADWQVEDHLIAFSYRIKPLKNAASKLLEAGMHVFRVLWPDAEMSNSPITLAEALMNAGVQLTN